MKFKIRQFDNPTVIRAAEVHKMNVKFNNLTSINLDLPKEYFTPASYSYELADGKIVGNRSCLVDDTLYIDTPMEWGKSEFLDYVARVKKTHNREFASFIDYMPNTGEGELLIPRPYIHVEEPAFFCGCVEYWNFGFFLSVLMQKVYFAFTLDPERPILVPICVAWQVALLRTFFPTARFIFFDANQIVSFKNVTVIGWPGFGFHVSYEYVNYLRNAVAIGRLDGAVDPSNIWFARRDGIYGKRFEMTKVMSSNLIARGYTPVYPELLSPDKIAKMVNGSKSVILDSGSALFNLLFAKNHVTVKLFESRSEFLLNHSRFMNSCHLNSQVLFVNEDSDLAEIKREIFN